jgi:hypothetical protein
MTTGTSPVACRSLMQAVCVWRIDSRPTDRSLSRKYGVYPTLSVLHSKRFLCCNLIRSVVKVRNRIHAVAFRVLTSAFILTRLCLVGKERRCIPLPAQGW